MPEELLGRSSRTRTLLRLLPIGMVATLIAFVFAAYAITRQHNQAADTQARICRIANFDRIVLRNLVQLAQKNSRITLKHQPVQLAQAERFYREALSLIAPVDCKDV